MKQWIIAAVLLFVCMPLRAEIISGEVMGVSVIRKAIFVQYTDAAGHREVAKLLWSESLPERHSLENAEIGDRISLIAGKGEEDQWLVQKVASSSRTEPAEPAEASVEDLSMPVDERSTLELRKSKSTLPSPSPLMLAEVKTPVDSFTQFRNLEERSVETLGPGAPMSSRQTRSYEEVVTPRSAGNPLGFFIDVINGAARSVKGAVDSTGRAVTEVLP